MAQRRMPRVQDVVLPLLRDALTDDVTVGSWVNDIDYRTFPLVNVRRIGGTRHSQGEKLLDQPVIELTVFTTEGLPETEDLYNLCLDALYDAVDRQTITEHGYLCSIEERMGMTQFSSLFTDSWRVQGLIALGVRPLRTTRRS